MLADYRVCIDACVLANYAVSDLLLRLAERPRIYTPVFSEMILDEVRSTHVEKLGWAKRSLIHGVRPSARHFLKQS
jgi:tetrahydromethanopterin S-methyltransferase subunit E